MPTVTGMLFATDVSKKSTFLSIVIGGGTGGAAAPHIGIKHVY